MDNITPGFNCRITIYFQTNKKGMKAAYRWSASTGRAFRLSLAVAETLVAQGQAELLQGCPPRQAIPLQKTSVPRSVYDPSGSSLSLQEVSTPGGEQALFSDNDVLSSEAWDWMKARYQYTCLCCRKQEPDIKLCADHVIPKTKGGQNTVGNTQPLCVSCNAKKHAKIIDYRENFR